MMVDSLTEENDIKYEVDIEKIKDSVTYLEQWLTFQDHLPKNISKTMLYQFAGATKGDKDKACRKLDSYYTVRNLIPEFFSIRDPTMVDIEKNYRCVAINFLSGTTMDGCKVMSFVLLNTDPTELDLTIATRRLYMCTDFILMSGGLKPGQGIYLLIDAKGVTVGHLMKFYPSIVRKIVICLTDVYPLRLKGIVFVNLNDIIKAGVNTLVRPFFPAKLRNRFYLFGSKMEGLYKLIPKEILPKELDGRAAPYNEHNLNMYDEIVATKSWFLTEGSEKSDESKRIGKCPLNVGGCSIM